MKGNEQLTYSELESWQRLTGYKLSPGEVDLIFIIDLAHATTAQTASI